MWNFGISALRTMTCYWFAGKLIRLWMYCVICTLFVPKFHKQLCIFIYLFIFKVKGSSSSTDEKEAADETKTVSEKAEYDLYTYSLIF